MIMKKELLYPFDANYILAKKKRIKRELLAEGESVQVFMSPNITSIMRMQYLIMQNWRHLHRI